MIDTIVLRFHDLRIHASLMRYLRDDYSGYTTSTAVVPREKLKDMDHLHHITTREKLDILKMNKSGEFLVRFQKNKKLNNSHHYYLAYHIDTQKDYIEFNFSIPKYIFGTNILMFVNHFNNKNFAYHLNGEIKYNLKHAFPRLKGFIKHFVNAEFGELPIRWDFVEVNRIDLCYNQVFNSKDDALRYLEYQKQIKKKHAREDGDYLREYQTSIMYKTKRYSAKIYHKGTEYEKHDKREHRKINKEKGRNYFNIEGLQRFSDKILRYEITFRSSYLSYLFRQNIFRRRCEYHQNSLEIYKEVESKKRKNDKISERIARFKNEGAKERYRISNPYYKIEKSDQRIHKQVDALLNKGCKFMLVNSKRDQEFNSVTIPQERDHGTAKFDEQVLRECSIVFYDFIMQYQVKEKPMAMAVADLIDQYNASHYNQLPKREMMKFYEHLLINGTFENVRDKEYYSRSTYYRYKERFKKIGITEQNIIPNCTINVSPDLRAYHQQVIYNANLFPRM